MRDALRHRGPDDEGLWCDGEDGGPTVALAHTRLAILDLSPAGRQPMQLGETSPVITYNGEVFNFRELRAHADGVLFRTGTDTEVVLRGYERWGVDVVRRLEGMFAFAVWDRTRQRLVLARDRLGIKPLYYCAGSGFFAFASELRALLATGLVPRHLDSSSLWHYLGYQTAPTPRTLLASVRMLEPGHLLTVDRSGHIESRQYWDFLASADPAAHEADRDEARRRVAELLDAAAASHLVSDVPVGLFLSGGIDSSALVALLRARGVRPQTFTVSFAEHTFDESAHARRIADAFGAEHTEIPVRESDVLDLLPAFLDSVDHPSGDGVNTYVVSHVVRERGLKVALSGLGGDEVFGGYPSFRRMEKLLPASQRWGRSPRAVRKAAAGVVRALGGASVATSKAAAVVESDGGLADVWPVMRQMFSTRERQALMPEAHWPAGTRPEPYAPLLAEAYARALDAELWSQVSYAEARVYMHDVLLRDTDQMSMAHALEVRVPLLDHRLVEYVIGLPDRVKRLGATPKALLTDSLPMPLPREAADRPKMGFTLPFERWMRGALEPVCARHLGSDGLEGRGLFRSGQVDRLWQAFRAGKPGVTWSRIWTLVALDAWMERNGVTGPSA
jgi:asparagine synthase (glutamine-hydrolysing)